MRDATPMTTYLLTLAVCLVIILFMVLALVLSRTPRYRTTSEDLLGLLDDVLAWRASEQRWLRVIGYPIRHDPDLENIRRRCQAVMNEHGQTWRQAQGGPLFSRAGLEEIAALHDYLKAHHALRERS